jgi:hypothetical protein
MEQTRVAKNILKVIQKVRLRRIVADFPPQRPGCEPRSGDVGCVVEKVALG